MDDAKMLELLHKNPNKGMNMLMNKYVGLVYATVKHVLANSACNSSYLALIISSLSIIYFSPFKVNF